MRDDLARMHRVLERLLSEGRETELANRIASYLGLFGNLPCQQRPGLPSHGDCNSCGHKDVCVILPETAA